MSIAAIYCRISRDPTGRELGVKRQEADCRALCEREGFEVVEVFVDDDRSAYSGKLRPAFDRMTELLKSGTVDALVAWHPDRITRQPRELEDLIDLLDATSTTVRTVQTGEYDLSTPSGRMSARIVGAVARHESEHKSVRLRRKHVELAEAGAVSGGGDRPFGYEADRVTVRDDEAEIVREMARRTLEGESLRSLCADLNAREVATTAGQEWRPSKLRRVIGSPRVAGLRAHRGEIVGEAVWPAIIDADDHYRLAALLRDPARRKHAGGRERKLLTGLVVCGRCGAQMVSRPRQDRTPTYVCASGPGLGGCGKMRVLGEPLDEMVTDAVLFRLDSPAVAEALADDGDDRALLDEIRRVDERRDELAAMWASGEVSRSEWQAAVRALEKRTAELEAALARHAEGSAVASDIGDSGGIREVWPELRHDRRRAVLAAVIEKIEVAPAVRGRNRFDADRVSVRWRA